MDDMVFMMDYLIVIIRCIFNTFIAASVAVALQSGVRHAYRNKPPDDRKNL